ncbi:hypothetical protein ABEB36_013206 [Hypothenemus hampei]|uniref:aralkylamine N-acetyltransferase n=1 Tax=Hypothenemus hampei TaxID=57062 RepID=A0ABD1E7I5_HYPHA
MSSFFGSTIFKILNDSGRYTKQLHTTKNLSFFRKKAQIKEPSPYIIVRATREEFHDILKVMHEGYYDEEPILTSLQVPPNPVLDDRAIQAMTKGYTLVAKCKYNGSIVGACINESTTPWDADMDDKLACKVQCEHIRQLIMFYSYIMRAPDLWRCLGVRKVYEMAYLFVKRPHRRKGLAYKLLNESKILGTDAGFKVIRCDATNIHTAKICERLGMQKVAEIPYCSYLNQNLEPIFNPPWPHQSVKIYCDCAPQYNDLKKKIKESTTNVTQK